MIARDECVSVLIISMYDWYDIRLSNRLLDGLIDVKPMFGGPLGRERNGTMFTRAFLSS